MAFGALTLYMKDVVPTGATLHRSLSESASGISAATLSTGWTPGTNASTRFALQNGGSKVASASFGGTTLPTAAPSATVGDCWRSENTYTGTFTTGTWALKVGLRSVTAALSGSVNVRIRLWRSTDPNGVGATEFTTAAAVSTSTGALNTSTDVTVTATTLSIGPVRLTDEFIFVTVAMGVIGASGSATADALFRTDTSAAYALVTPTFNQDGQSIGYAPPRGGVAYLAPYTATSGTVASVLPAMCAPVIDTQGTFTGHVYINGVAQRFARVCLYYRKTGALVSTAITDAAGVFTFNNLDRNALTDNSYFAVALDPNGLGTVYNSAIFDRLIPG